KDAHQQPGEIYVFDPPIPPEAARLVGGERPVHLARLADRVAPQKHAPKHAQRVVRFERAETRCLLKGWKTSDDVVLQVQLQLAVQLRQIGGRTHSLANPQTNPL